MNVDQDMTLEARDRLWELAIDLAAAGHRAPDQAAAVMAEVVRREAAALGTETGSPARYARALHDYCFRLKESGQLHRALEQSDEAISIRRGLVDEEPTCGEHLFALASSLNTRANVLRELRRHSEAIEPAFEAVRLYGQLADGKTELPAPWAAQLPARYATAQTNLSLWHTEQHEWAEARLYAEGAVALFEGDEAPDDFDTRVRHALARWALVDSLAGAGLLREALIQADIEIGMRRRLARELPAVHERILQERSEVRQSIIDRLGDA